MKKDRRQFLEEGLIVAGAVGAGLVASALVLKFAKEDPPRQSLRQSLLPVLAPTGELIRAEAPKGAPEHPPSHVHAPPDNAAERLTTQADK